MSADRIAQSSEALRAGRRAGCSVFHHPVCKIKFDEVMPEFFQILLNI
jgi:hypothetical protein